ncbi:MAG: tRNA 5-methylaminomethyl-2-thiouridine synthase [Bradyrhizobium sp.]|uniref:DUF6894 family protein n=1 Tax=Bradyrhizobium sp. TaxID=376 RepID=UPI0025C03C69|nr:tRNA 5-methylaminomethyl-2-thiouridine synthase [Bradyrhizobium sp.]MBI5264763.1 tRNA 5-methylaminomethyl-2-thiouridine synthase [Bradyrhizobium sp.]
MPRYFFHIDGSQPYRDEDGEELIDDDAAWRLATRVTRDIETSVRPGDSWELEVWCQEAPVFRIDIKTEWVR